MIKQKKKVFNEFKNVKENSEIYSKSSLIREYKEADFKDNIDKLRQSYSINKKYPKEIELPLLLALSRFPDLKNVKIEFQFYPVFMVMVARPRLNFFLKKQNNRKYRIYINTIKFPIKGVLYSELPFNAKVGCLAHELSHIVDYTKKSNKDIFAMFFKYFFKSYRKKVEWKTDLEAINRGFAFQIFDFTSFLLHDSDSSSRYKKMKKKNYLTDEDIFDYIKMVYEEDLRWI